jgi:hypothetical protein
LGVVIGTVIREVDDFTVASPFAIYPWDVKGRVGLCNKDSRMFDITVRII